MSFFTPHSIRCIVAVLLAQFTLQAHTTGPVVVDKDTALSRLLSPITGDGPLVPAISHLQETLRTKPEDGASLQKLGRCLIAQARLPGCEALYTQAEVCGQYLEMLQPQNPAALQMRGHALLAMHKFHDAEDVARRLVAIRQDMEDHALLGDALMEQGMLDEALPAYQAMIDAKPCLPSYSRIAHFRWLKGDLEGAIEMASLAASCGSYRDVEPLAWVTARLAFYLWQNNDLERALAAALRAEELVPKHPQALWVRGRVLLAMGKNHESVECLRTAWTTTPLPEVGWALVDALRATGEETLAEHQVAALLDGGEAADPRSFSLYLATMGERSDEALELAKNEMLVRRDVFSWDALAWSQYAAGEVKAAIISMRKALAEGTQDARLFLHAAVIAQASGEANMATTYLTKARAVCAQLLPSEQNLLTPLMLTASSSPSSPTPNP